MRDSSTSDKKHFEKSSFDRIRIMVLTIGFPRSGSSLLSYLLTAHPDIVIADEPTVSYAPMQYIGILKEINKRKRPDKDILYKADILKMFDYILSVDYTRSQYSSQPNETNAVILRGKRYERYIHVPNQYQGSFKSLKVIGIKHSRQNVEVLSKGKILENLKQKLQKTGIILKFIFTVRNPYDMIATAVRTNADDRKKFINFCEGNIKILKQVNAAEVFIAKHEDMVENPQRQLTKLCEFLQVSIPSGYLEDCVSQVVREPYRSRLELDWTEDQKIEVDSLIKKYDFFSGYGWDLKEHY